MKLIEYSFYQQLNHSTRIEAHTYHIITDESGITRFVVVVAQDGKVLKPRLLTAGRFMLLQ